ncbi:hypothetical protein SKA34_17688 [Photobacterium sp. SKA34]|uniref:DUF1488 domain-containing protein n=1 Tax=Photobacterium sp. SKA34 TaxID=121723 RepID=UPI00006ADCCC|nr:DUF1488 domain-containing protein [Photobacterium sp. SKA34]EAR55095.1 hypothetical protein SKA34_17688 [Photobacterium sp. SKA34]
MNQDILFSDIQSWDAVRQAVNFPAQQGGALIICWVTLNWLQQHSGKALNNEADILAEFSSMRFDLEELAEVVIEDESFDDDGDIVIE